MNDRSRFDFTVPVPVPVPVLPSRAPSTAPHVVPQQHHQSHSQNQNPNETEPHLRWTPAHIITTTTANPVSAAAAAAAAGVAPSPSGTATPPSSVSSEAAASQRSAPASMEWEANKDIISDLYMDKNLNLSEVVGRMKAHGLHATPRQYKAQFARWGWSKYNCKRMRSDLSSGKAVVKSQGKSCYRVKRSRAVKGGGEGRGGEGGGPVHELAAAGVASPISPASQPSQTTPSPSTTAPTSPAPVQAAASNTVIRRPSPHSPSYYARSHPSSQPQHHQPMVMLQHLPHANDTARFTQAVLSDIRSHVYEVISRKPDWHQSRTSKAGLINAYDYTSYDHFVVAMDAFLRAEHTNGGEMLRRAFLEVEEAIRVDYTCTFYFFFIDLPDLFLHYGRHDILTILLSHIRRLTTMTTSTAGGATTTTTTTTTIPGAGLASLCALAETDPAALRHYISTASGLWCDLLSELRGPRDRSTLLARRNRLRHDRGTRRSGGGGRGGGGNGDEEDDDDRNRRLSGVARLCEDYVVLLREVRGQYGRRHEVSLHMEDVCLSLQMSHDFFVDGFVEQNERLVRNVEAKYRVSRPRASVSSELGGTTETIHAITAYPPPSRHQVPHHHPYIYHARNSLLPSPTTTIITNDYDDYDTDDSNNNNNNNDDDDQATVAEMLVPLADWDVLDRNIRSNCYHRLSYYAQLRGDLDRAAAYLARAGEGWRGAFWQLEAETALGAAGRCFEAESLRRCRLEAQYFRKLPENDELLRLGGGPPGFFPRNSSSSGASSGARGHWGGGGGAGVGAGGGTIAVVSSSGGGGEGVI